MSIRVLQQEIKTKCCTVKLIEPGIIENEIHDNVELDVPEVLEMKDANKILADGRPYTVLVNSGQHSTVTEDAKKLSASSEFQQNAVAKAVLVDSLAHRIVGRFYVKVNKPSMATKIFSMKDRDEAIEWLREQLNK